MVDLPIWHQALIAFFLLAGAFFTLVGSIGLVRLPDYFMRMHAPTKASTLGIGGLLLASLLIGWTRGEPGLHVVLITFFLFVTAPVSANLLAQAGLHRRLPSKANDMPPADP